MQPNYIRRLVLSVQKMSGGVEGVRKGTCTCSSGRLDVDVAVPEDVRQQDLIGVQDPLQRSLHRGNFHLHPQNKASDKQRNRNTDLVLVELFQGF